MARSNCSRNRGPRWLSFRCRSRWSTESGKLHGYELDQGHIREFLATLGVGLTSQYLEQFGRKLLGGLLGKAMGSLGKQFGQSATSVAFSFATTYALGQVARLYYAGGRQMSTALLQSQFPELAGAGQGNAVALSAADSAKSGKSGHPRLRS